MSGVEKLDEKGMYGAKREVEGIEYRIEEGMLRREERRRLREGIGKELMRRR